MQWYMAEQLNFICILLLNALIQKIAVGPIREIFQNPFRISQILSKLVQKHSYSDLPKYSKISIFQTSDHVNLACIQLLQKLNDNKAVYTATLVACRWAGAVLEKVTRASGQEPYAQKAQ